jgi:hypothetical protein
MSRVAIYALSVLLLAEAVLDLLLPVLHVSPQAVILFSTIVNVLTAALLDMLMLIILAKVANHHVLLAIMMLVHALLVMVLMAMTMHSDINAMLHALLAPLPILTL